MKLSLIGEFPLHSLAKRGFPSLDMQDSLEKKVDSLHYICRIPSPKKVDSSTSNERVYTTIET